MTPEPVGSSRGATAFASVVATAEAVAATRSRTAKVELLAELLARLDAVEVEPVVGFLSASVRQGRLGVGWRTLADLAVAPAEAASLTVTEVDAAIGRLAEVGGTGSATLRAQELTRLMSLATAAEQRLLTAILLGEIRIGALDGVLVDGVARAAGRPLEEVRRADLSRVGDRSRDPVKVGRLLRSLARHVATEATLATLAEDSERAAALRQCSPFTGILTPAERFEFLRAWSRSHAA